MIKLIKEDKIQDTRLIFENITPESEAHSERRETELSAPGDITSSFQELLIKEQGQDSGVGSSGTAITGLLTPERTPDPENIPGLSEKSGETPKSTPDPESMPGLSERSGEIGQAEIGRLSPVSEARETGREVHLPDYTEETTSRDQTQPSLEARDQTTDALESSARAETEERDQRLAS